MLNQLVKCEHGLPMFQTCRECGRKMMVEADEAFVEACKEIIECAKKTEKGYSCQTALKNR